MDTKLNDFTEMSKLLSVKSRVNHDLISLFSKFAIGRLLCKLSLEKQAGVLAVDLIVFLCLFRINDQTIHKVYQNKFYNLLSTGKNCFYRMMNRSQMDWRKLLWGMAMRFFALLRKEDAKGVDGARCLIIDDTTHRKRGKNMEFISRVFDHTLGKCVLGYKHLICAYTDGKSTIPVDMSIHREKGEDGSYGLSEKARKSQFHQKRQAGDPDSIRAKECDKSKIDVAIEMVKRALSYKLDVNYVLADSWFVCESLMSAVEKEGKGKVHFLGLAKMGNTRYMVEGQRHNVYELISKYERNARQCRKYKCLYIALRGQLGNLPVKLFIIKYGHNSNWNIMITTDMSINFVKAFETYQLRWNIEVMIKECRQYLGLASWQGRSLNGHIADSTLCFITYIVMALEKRLSDYETLGQLFDFEKEELLAMTLWRRVLACIEKLLYGICMTLGMTPDDVVSRLMENDESASEILFLAQSLEEYRQQQSEQNVA